MKTTHSAELPKAPGAAISESPSPQSAEGANPIPHASDTMSNTEPGAQPSPTSSSSSSSSSPSNGEAAPADPREAPDNPQPSTFNPQPAPPRATGRPSKLTPALITSICHKICEFGLSDSAAAAHCGIPASTLSRWKFLNPELELRFLSAREDFRIRHIHEIQHAATKDGRRDWRAAAWLLERIFPEDYARRPGRRVNPASENQTWLDQARAENTASEHRFYQHEIERAFQWRGDQARDFMSDPDWDRKEGNIGCLPTEEYLNPTDNPDPDILPKSYATYAEATEDSLRQAKAAHPSTPASAPAPEPPQLAEPAESRLPHHHHLHLPQETVPLPTTRETPQTTSKITETPENAVSYSAARAAEGRTQASPGPASVTSAAPGHPPKGFRPEGTAQENSTPPTAPEIALRRAGETLPPPLKTPATEHFQNYRNSHPSPKILTSEILAQTRS